jgi:hypothetical protein
MHPMRAFKHHASPPMLVALTALVVAMSGTAVAATGGEFILGKTNKAISITSLSNSKGTALALSAAHGKPPLTVSNSAQIPKLNASLLDGQASTAFLPIRGTAANSDELGGLPAVAYMTGDGEISHEAGYEFYNFDGPLNLNIPDNAFQIGFNCSKSSVNFDFFDITANTAVDVWAYNSTGTEQNFSLAAGGYGDLQTGIEAPSPPSTLMLQVTFGSNMVTVFLSSSLDTTSQTCNFAAQTIADG